MSNRPPTNGWDPDRARFRSLGGYAGVGVDEARDFLRRMRPPGGPTVARVYDVVTATEDAVPARIYHPRPGATLPVLVWTHGGGWCVGDLDTTDTVCRHLASHAGCVVVSVDHRRAPEHPFPAPLDDVTATIAWVLNEAPTIGADRERIAVGGESSGANLTLAALLRLRDTAVKRVGHQLLVVPVADLEDRPSMGRDTDPSLTAADLRWFASQYVPDPQQRHDPFVAPLRSSSLGGLPPAIVVTAGLDPLRDSGLALVERLSAEAVAVDHLHRPTVGHGLFGDVSSTSPGGAAIIAMAALLRTYFSDMAN